MIIGVEEGSRSLNRGFANGIVTVTMNRSLGNLVGLLMGLMFCASGPVWGQYPTYAQIEADLLAAETNYPSLCKRYYLGDTQQNRSMWALRISDNVLVEEDEPEFRYISTMHGDEVTGVEMCRYLIDYLTSNYGTDSRVTNIVDSIEIWIVPCMNPDGYVAGQRRNSNNVDLNRDFPDPYSSPSDTLAGRAVETGNMMDWFKRHSFTLGANYHGGELVVNYPFDTNPTGSSVYTASPDDDVFIWMSEQYSVHNNAIWTNQFFYHGITNGADWYAISGGMQDYSYRYLGTNEVTIEVSDTKTPQHNEMAGFWDDNRESMLTFLEASLTGVRGLVTDALTGNPIAATVRVAGRDHDVYGDPDVGDYHRMLLPGLYDLGFSGEGYDDHSVSSVAVAGGDATRVDVALWATRVLEPSGGRIPPGMESTIRWSGNPARQFQVQYSSNANEVTAVTDGFETGSLGGDYSTGGSASWSVTSSLANSGSFCAKAGTILDNQTTWMTRTFPEGELCFWYQVSSEAGWDFFNFYVDGDKKIGVSGVDGGWNEYCISLGSGSHVLRWEYEKDTGASQGSDTVWIDDVSHSVDNTVWTDIVALTGVGATSVLWTPMVEGNSYRVRVRSYDGVGTYGAWDESPTFRVEVEPEIPTVSDLGLLTMLVLVGVAGAKVIQKRKSKVGE